VVRQEGTVPLVCGKPKLARNLEAVPAGAACWIVGTAGRSEQLIYQVESQGRSCIVMGLKGSGMRRPFT